MSGLFSLERRALLRSPRGRLVAVSLWVASLLSVGLGAALADHHRDAAALDVAAFEKRLEAADEKSAFALAAWQDLLVARGAGRSAALTAGDLSSLPDAAVMRLADPPAMVPSLAERSPSALLLGTLDVAWVLALLLPLAAIALAYDAVSRDRERGTLAMMLVFARRSAPLLFARTAAVALVLIVGVLPAAIGAIFVGPAVVVLIVAYAWFVAAGVVTISAASERSATALAVAFGAWLLLAVAVPLAGSAAARLSYPEPDPRLRLAGDQAADDVLARATEGIVAAEAAKDPALDPEDALDGPSSQMRYDFLLLRERLRRKRGAAAADERMLQRRAEVLELTSWLSPSSIVAGALGALGGTRPSERITFASDAEKHRAAVEAFVRKDVIDGRETLGRADRFPRIERNPPVSSKPAWWATGIFAVLGVLMLVFVSQRLDRGPLAPTKEDA